jgi:hypothetical protein
MAASLSNMYSASWRQRGTGGKGWGGEEAGRGDGWMLGQGRNATAVWAGNAAVERRVGQAAPGTPQGPRLPGLVYPPDPQPAPAHSSELTAFASSVLPTPVGPRNMKDAMGRLGSDSPARERWMASATASTASSCPITRRCSSSDRCSSFSRSLQAGRAGRRQAGGRQAAGG